jgi:hypothetical protein
MSNSWQGPGSYTASEVEEIVEHSRRTPRHVRAAAPGPVSAHSAPRHVRVHVRPGSGARCR